MRKEIKKKIFITAILIGFVFLALSRLKYICENDELGFFINEYFEEMSK